METNKIYNRNCIEGMNDLPTECVDLVVTSPPYDDLRTYNDSSKWDHNVFTMVADAITRVLKPGGIIMWNVADAVVKGSETGSSFRQCLYFKDQCGLNIHDTMIYHRASCSFPSGNKSNRYSQHFEYCFILSKGKPKTANLIRDKKNVWAGSTSWGNSASRKRDGELDTKTTKSKVVQEYGIRENIWRIKNSGGFGQSDKNAYKHPATMPEELARDHIISWSNPGDIVLDPFSGSGTTAREALKLDRRYIGYELDPTYYQLSIDMMGQNIFDIG